MLIAEFTVSEMILHSTLSAFTDVHLSYEELYRTKSSDIRLFFWMAGVDSAAFETAVEDDPTVTGLRRLTASDSMSLYRVDFTPYGRDRSTFSRWSEDDVVLLEADGTHDGWQLRMRFPDRATLIEYREAYTAMDCPFFLLSLYRETDPERTGETALTSRQRDALLTAYESGYFEIPRRLSQKKLGAQLDVSSQSISERLRRAISALIESTIRRN